MGDWQKTDKMKDVEKDRERAIQAQGYSPLCFCATPNKTKV